MWGRGRPKVTREQLAEIEMIACGIDGTLPEDRKAWKAVFRRPDPATDGIGA